MTDLPLEVKNIREKIAQFSEADLLQRRAELQAIGRNAQLRPDGLNADELTEICEIYTRLRTRKNIPTSGTKAAAKRNSKHINAMSIEF